MDNKKFVRLKRIREMKKKLPSNFTAHLKSRLAQHPSEKLWDDVVCIRREFQLFWAAFVFCRWSEKEIWMLSQWAVTHCKLGGSIVCRFHYNWRLLNKSKNRLLEDYEQFSLKFEIKRSEKNISCTISFPSFNTQNKMNVSVEVPWNTDILISLGSVMSNASIDKTQTNINGQQMHFIIHSKLSSNKVNC